MKIDQGSLNSKALLLQKTNQNQNNKGEAKKVDSKSFDSSHPSSKLNLSKTSQDFQKIKDLVLKDSSKSREEKISRLQKLIDSGEYDINEEAVAENLVKEHLIMRDS